MFRILRVSLLEYKHLLILSKRRVIGSCELHMLDTGDLD